MQTVSCVIPAYKESERIKGVLTVARQNTLITEIIVVEDGSPDQAATKAIVDTFPGVIFIQQEVNQGKSKALYTGITRATGEYLLLLDADLLNLTSEDLTKLIEPVLSNNAEMSISMRGNSPWIDRKLGLDFISGERVFKKSFLHDEIEKIPELSRFGFETFLNTVIIEKHCSLAVVSWPDVASPYKMTKRGIVHGLFGELKMYVDICRVLPFYQIPWMFYRMLKLRVPMPTV